jgi:MFS family permease
MGLREAFFAAYRPLHLRDDLRRFPAIVTHWSVWGPIAVAVLATILEIAVGANNSLSSFLFSLFVAPGAVAGVFIAGYFAPTAAYLAGLVVALASSILFAIAAWAAYSSGTSGLTEEVVVGSITTGFIIGPLYGIFLGATAAWYKRFLAATSPARPPRPTAQQSGNRRRQGPRAKTR